MHGTITLSFTPEQLIEEMLSNIDGNEMLSERKAFALYTHKSITEWLKDKLIERIHSGADGSKIAFRRKDLEALKLKEKYLNKI